MKTYIGPITGLLVVLALVISGFVFFDGGVNEETAPSMENVTLSGASVLSFGPENVLFVGDSKAGQVHAIMTEATEVSDPVPFNYLDFDLKIAEQLDMSPRDLIIQDMKIHPVSQEAYVAVKKGHEPEAPSMIAIVSPMSPDIRFLEISDVNSVSIKNPASDELKFWRDIPASSFSITDIDYHGGYIYVAGLSNGEFASTIRKIAYPFDDAQEMVGSIEIYHAIHTQNETRAPIRTMAIEEIDGVPTLIASYTCTPLVTIPLSEIQEGNDIKGKTIAELGYGNTPIDMITYMAQEQDGSFDKKLLVTNRHRSGSLISVKDIAEAMQGEGLAGQTGFSGAPAGLNIFPAPTSSTLHIDNQNQMMVALLNRNLETGGLELVSEVKGVFLRLSEFVSEYDFPDYQYDEKQAMTQQFHDMIKPMEGYPELASDNE